MANEITNNTLKTQGYSVNNAENAPFIRRPVILHGGRRRLDRDFCIDQRHQNNVSNMTDRFNNYVRELIQKFQALFDRLNQAATPAPGEAETPPVDETCPPTTPAPTTPVEDEPTCEDPSEVTPEAVDPTETEPEPKVADTLTQPGFLWKPQGAKEGKLLVCLPEKYTGKVKSVKILSADGSKVLGSGHFEKVGSAGRERYEFKKAGDKYPAGAIIEIELENGKRLRKTIEAPAEKVTT
jgi:hypothetical protein